MKFKRYEKYKSSDIDWLGEIPREWKIFRVKDIGSVRSGDSIIANDLLDNGKYEVYGGNGFIGLTNKYNVQGESIIVGRVGAKCGNVRFIKERKFISDNALILKLKNRENSYFFSIVLEAINLNRFNLSSAQPLITGSQLLNTQILIPKTKIQIAIIDYLEKQTSFIDKKIELLKAKKQKYLELKKTLISEIVTKGLDKNVEMKDSGIEWIGKIPKHWEIKRNKELYKESKIISTTGKEDLLSVSEYTGVSLRKKDVDTGENDTRADSLIGYKVCNIGDLVINIMLAWKSGLGVTDFFGITSPSYAVFSHNALCEPKYYHYLFRTENYVMEFKRNSSGIIDSRLRLYPDKFYSISSVVPPKSEQIAITNYLDEKTYKIDKIIQAIDKSILVLQEYRKTLINDVVTGKVKII